MKVLVDADSLNELREEEESDINVTHVARYAGVADVMYQPAHQRHGLRKAIALFPHLTYADTSSGFAN